MNRMDPLESSAPLQPEPHGDSAGPAPFNPAAFNRLFALLGWPAAALLVAWIAEGLKRTGHAPELLFPLGVGAVLGAVLLAIQVYGRLTVGRTAIVAAAGCGLLTVLAEEYFAHLAHRRSFTEVQNRSELSPLARLAAGEMAPPDLAADVAANLRLRGPGLWTFDAAATIAAAASVVAIGARRRRQGDARSSPQAANSPLGNATDGRASGSATAGGAATAG